MADAVLLIDDDVDLLRAAGAQLERAGYDVTRELSGEAGLATWDRIRPDVVILDLDLPGMQGSEVLSHLRDRGAAVIVVAPSDQVSSVVRALQSGAESWVAKPVELSLLEAAVARLADKVRTRRARRVNEAVLAPEPGLTLESLGTSAVMLEIAQQVKLLASSERTTVLVEGEVGTGKLWVSRLIHGLSPRARQPFLSVSCAGIPAGQLEVELFGQDKGGDGRERRQGLFEIADRGTLFLGEIADLPPELQPKLLKVLETRTFRRAGGTREITVDVRLIASTSRSLANEVEGGQFREDLFYRLSVMPLRLPPLRDRSREDRTSLVLRLQAELRRDLPDGPSGLPAEVLERLVTYNWPGNVREMRNVLERALILGRGLPQVAIEHLPGEFRNRPGIGDRRHAPMTLDELERQHIERTLRHHNGNRTRAAHELGISRATLINKIKRYAINV
jgi:DNA-binding NtrC family response regulator